MVELLKGRVQELNQGHSRWNINVLVEVADLDTFLPLDAAVDRQDLADQDLDQGTLTGPVLADDSHVFVFFQLKAGVFIELLVGVAHRQAFNI